MSKRKLINKLKYYLRLSEYEIVQHLKEFRHEFGKEAIEDIKAYIIHAERVELDEAEITYQIAKDIYEPFLYERSGTKGYSHKLKATGS